MIKLFIKAKHKFVRENSSLINLFSKWIHFSYIILFVFKMFLIKLYSKTTEGLEIPKENKNMNKAALEFTRFIVTKDMI